MAGVEFESKEDASIAEIDASKIAPSIYLTMRHLATCAVNHRH